MRAQAADAGSATDQRSKPQCFAASRSTRRRGARSASRPTEAVRATVSSMRIAELDQLGRDVGRLRVAEREASQRKPLGLELEARWAGAGVPGDAEIGAQLAGERRRARAQIGLSGVNGRAASDTAEVAVGRIALA